MAPAAAPCVGAPVPAQGGANPCETDAGTKDKKGKHSHHSPSQVLISERRRKLQSEKQCV